MISRDKHVARAVLAVLHWTHSQCLSQTDTGRSQLRSPPRALEGRGGRQCHLVPVESDGCQGQRGDVEGAVLHKAADVAHGLSKNPRAVHKPDLMGNNSSISQKIHRDFVFQSLGWNLSWLKGSGWLGSFT